MPILVMTMVASSSKHPASTTLSGGGGGGGGGVGSSSSISTNDIANDGRHRYSTTNENSNSSNETVIARLHHKDHREHADLGKANNIASRSSDDCNPKQPTSDGMETLDGVDGGHHRGAKTTPTYGRYSIKNLLHLAGQHLNVFHHHHQHHHPQDGPETLDASQIIQLVNEDKLGPKQPHSEAVQLANQIGQPDAGDQANKTPGENIEQQQQQQQHLRHHLVFAWAKRYLRLGYHHSGNKSASASAGGHANSAPVTPIRSSHHHHHHQTTPDDGDEPPRRRAGTKSNGLMAQPAARDESSSQLRPPLVVVAAGRQHHHHHHQWPPNGAAGGEHEVGCPRALAGAEGQPAAAASRPSVRFVDPATSTNAAGHAGGSSGSNSDSTTTSRACNRTGPAGSKQPASCSQRQRRTTTANSTQNHDQNQEQVRFADCAVQTSLEERRHSKPIEGRELEDDEDDDDPETRGIKLVARLFKLPPGTTTTTTDDDKCGQLAGAGESPMDSGKFRDYGYKLIDYISNYLDTIRERRVTPLNIEPGYLKSRVQPDAPERGESFARIMHDFESHIMCGITHWQHPHFHAYFPAGNAYPSILADMLSDALGCVGFSWAASPAYTELEIIMLDWMGKMIGLPDEFLCLSKAESKGGGVIQGSASECVLVNLLAARHWAMERLRRKYPGTPDGLLLGKLVGYCSKEAHSCVEKASMIGFIKMRTLETDERHSLRGDTLARAIEADRAQGLEPFIVCATLGTTSCVSFDNLEELGQVCRRRQRPAGDGDGGDDDDDDIWLHVDAAYAGSALICPEFKHLMRGIEMASSFNMNPNKWMLINFDCSLMWVKDRFKLTRAFVVDPLYLQHSFSDQAIDYRHWGIPLSRRFRALKLWFVIRNYGVEGLRDYIRNHVRLAKRFESLIREDKRFMVTNEVVLGLVCFRLVGSNALNQRLLSMINASGKLHMVPASLNGRYVIRFCVCDQNAKESDILYAYQCISGFATELFELIRAGKERIRAISQQNTIDISSISLHTQQSASADRLNGTPGEAADDDDELDGGELDGGGGGGQTTSLHTSNGLVRQQQQQRAAMARVLLAKQQSLRGSGARQRGSRLGARANSSLASTTAAATGCIPPDGSLGPLEGQSAAKAPAPGSPSLASRSPLTKQISMALAGANLATTGQHPGDQQQLDRQPPGLEEEEAEAEEEEDLEQEVPLDSPADFDDLDLEEVDDEDLPDEAAICAAAEGQPIGGQAGDEPPGGGSAAGAAGSNATGGGGGGGGDQQPRRFDLGAQRGASETQASSAGNSRHGRLSRGGRASRTLADDGTTAAGAGGELEQEEAADEVYKLADKRHKMSLRYKREFFVRVVSDPRVYRASISGDIN